MTDKHKRLTTLTLFFRISGILLLIAGFVFLLPAQSGAEKGESASRLQQGNELSNLGLYDSALVIYREALALSRMEPDPLTSTRSLAQIGMMYSRLQQLEEASHYLDSAIAMAGVVDSLDRGIFFARKEKALIAQHQGNYASAIEGYQSLIDDLEQAQPQADSFLAMGYGGLAQVLAQQGDLTGALEMARKSRQYYLDWNQPDHPGLAYIENTLGIIQMYRSSYDDAIRHFNSSVNLLSTLYSEDHPHVISIRGNLGVLYGEQGLYRQARQVYEANLPHLNQLDPSSHLNGLLNMAGVLIMLEDYAEADRYLNEAETLCKSYPALKTTAWSHLLYQTSIVEEYLGDIDTALTMAGSSISALTELYGEESEELLDAYLQMGDLLQEKGMLDSAHWYMNLVLSISEEKYGKESQEYASATQDLGEWELSRGNGLQAVVHFLDAAGIYDALDHKSGQVASLIWAAEASRESGQPEEALVIHRQAWETLLPDVPFSIAPERELARYWDEIHILYLLKEQGNTLQSLYAEPGEQSRLVEALACTEVALDVLDSLRMFSHATESGGILMSSHRDLVENAISLSLALADQTGDQAHRLHAWRLADRARANQLRDHLRGVEALQVAGIPDSLLAQEDYFRQRLAHLRDLAGRSSGNDADSLNALIFSLTYEYEALIQRFEEAFPDYYSLKYHAASLDPIALMDDLDRNQMVVEFFWGEDSLYIFSAFRDESWVHSHAIASGMSEKLATWISYIRTPPGEHPNISEELPFELCRLLLPSMPEKVERLLIVPDGNLSYLPFESLLMSTSGGATFRDWDFLGKTLSVVYVPSLSLWMESDPEDKEYAEYVGFAPDFQEGLAVAERGQLRPLRYSQSEVEETAELLEGDAFLGGEANESNLRAIKEDFYVYHFATHALTGLSEVEDGRLFLAQGDSAVGQDGVLSSSEIYGLRMASPLVVLSACETGSGTLQQGEGLLSLARAFQYSGADRVMAGLWSTDDEAGYQLVTGFFRELKRGRSTGESLLRSRQSWLESAPDAQCHPYYWAGLILIGDDTDLLLKVNRGLPWWEIFIGSFVAIFLYLWWWSRGNQRGKNHPA